MKLTGLFNLASKTESELRGILRALFNELADPHLCQFKKSAVCKQIRNIQQLLCRR